MADKERLNEFKEVKEEEITEKVTPVSEKKAPVLTQSRKRIAAIILGAVVLYLVLMMLGFWALHAWTNDRLSDARSGSTATRGFDERGRMSDRTFMSRESESDGLTTTTTTTTYTQTQGVVTSVTGDTIVVAGGGKTQTIKTNADTEYSADQKPAVNDTIVVVGTKDGDTITATQVRVYTY